MELPFSLVERVTVTEREATVHTIQNGEGSSKG